MKKIVVLISLIFSVISMVVAQNQLVKFETNLHDFGKIKEEAIEHIYEFRFANTSSSKILISNVIASCGCTTPTWTKDSVSAGKSGFVKAVFNSTNRPGLFEKTLKVVVSSPTKTDTIQLGIKGEVMPKPKTGKLDFPDKLGAIRVQSRYLNLGNVKTTDKPSEFNFGIYNDTTFDVTLKLKSVPFPKYMNVQLDPEVLKPGQRGNIRVTYNAKDRGDYGYVSDYFELETNEESGASKIFYMATTIEEYFPPMTEAQLAFAPKMAVDKKEYDFRTVREGELAKVAFVLTNTGKTELVIRKTKASCGCTATEPEKSNLAPGESTNINVTFNSKDRSGTQTKTITVFTNDPTSPVQYLTIKAFVVK